MSEIMFNRDRINTDNFRIFKCDMSSGRAVWRDLKPFDEISDEDTADGRVLIVDSTKDDFRMEMEMEFSEIVPNEERSSLAKEIVSNLTFFDNEVQKFCEDSCNEYFDKYPCLANPQNYCVGFPYFVEISPNELKFGYGGMFVNIEVRAFFKKEGENWIATDFYWQ